MYTLKLIKNGGGCISIMQYNTITFSSCGSTSKDDTQVGDIHSTTGQTINQPIPIDVKDVFYVIDSNGNTVLSKKMDVRGPV